MAIGVSLIVAVGACGSGAPDIPADLVLTGGNIITMNAAAPSAEAIAVRGDRILAVGTREAIEELIDDDTQVRALDGATVVPGMIDAHVHCVGLGRRLLTLNAQGVSKEEIVAEIGRLAADTAPGEWIEGRGWDQNTWEVKEFPAKGDLDAVARIFTINAGIRRVRGGPQGLARAGQAR